MKVYPCGKTTKGELAEIWLSLSQQHDALGIRVTDRTLVVS